MIFKTLQLPHFIQNSVLQCTFFFEKKCRHAVLYLINIVAEKIKSKHCHFKKIQVFKQLTLIKTLTPYGLVSTCDEVQRIPI